MVTLKGEPIKIEAKLLGNLQKAPDFELCAADLKRVSLEAFEGKIKILNVFPSIDTGVCERSVIEFERRLNQIPNIVLVHISKDLPFAQKRFCDAKKFSSATTLSAYDSNFGVDYGVLILTGPLKGLLTRSVFLLNEDNQIVYHEIVPEITQEPNYGALIENLENMNH